MIFTRTNRLRKTKNPENRFAKALNKLFIISGLSFSKSACPDYSGGLNPAKSLVHCIPND